VRFPKNDDPNVSSADSKSKMSLPWREKGIGGQNICLKSKNIRRMSQVASIGKAKSGQLQMSPL
jgi:hypothetical protein